MLVPDVAFAGATIAVSVSGTVGLMLVGLAVRVVAVAPLLVVNVIDGETDAW